MTPEETEFAGLVDNYEKALRAHENLESNVPREPDYEMPTGRNTPAAMTAYKQAFAAYKAAKDALPASKANVENAFTALDNWIPEPAHRSGVWIIAPYLNNSVVGVKKEGKAFHIVRARSMQEIDGNIQQYNFQRG